MENKKVIETKGVPESLKGNERISSKSLKVSYSAEEKVEGEAQWVVQQRKAFQRWCNAFLVQRGLAINVLEEDISSGVQLCNLLELLSGKKLPQFNKTPKMKVQKVLNSQIALDWITKTEKLKLVGIGPEDIFDGKTKLILGLIWTLILRFQIQAGKWTVAGKKTTAKTELLEWVASVLADSGIEVKDFSGSWKDGLAFIALLNYLLRQKGIDALKFSRDEKPVEIIDRVFQVADAEFKIPKLLDANDMYDPDELSVMTYVSYFRQNDKLTPEEHIKRSLQGPVTTTKTTAPVAQAAPTRAVRSITPDGDGLSRAVCGELASFSCVTKDEKGEVLYSADTVFTGTLEMPKHSVAVSFADKKNGVHVGSYTVETAGTYDLTIILNKKILREKPYRVVAEPGAAWAPACYADGKGLTLTQSGASNQFKVYTFDRFNNAIGKGGNKIQVKFEGPEDISGVVRDESNGSYLVEYSVTKAGVFKIYVTSNGEPIKGSPFELVVEAGEVSAKFFIVEGEGLSKVVAGKVARFLVLVRDKFGNPSVKHGEARNISARLEGPSELDCSVEDLMNGSYSVTYEPSVSGKYKLFVQWNEEDAVGSPFGVTVSPGPLHAARSSAEGEGLSRAVAGTRAQFVITTRDAFRNRLTVGGAPIEASLHLDVAHDVVHGSITDNQDGTYLVIYILTIVGNYKLNAQIDGKPLQGSPFTVEAIAGPVDALQTIVEGNALSGVPAGDILYLVLRPRDKHGNAAIGRLEDIGASLEGPENVAVALKPNHGEKTFTLSAKPTRPADYLLNARYGGVPIKGSPYKIAVLAGKASAVHSIAEGDGIKANIAGRKATFKVLAKDESGNPVTFGGASIGGYLEGPAKVLLSDVIDHSNGTYTVHYIVKFAGPYHLHVTYDGYSIANSPFEVDVSPSAPHAKESVAYLNILFEKLFF